MPIINPNPETKLDSKTERAAKLIEEITIGYANEPISSLANLIIISIPAFIMKLISKFPNITPDDVEVGGYGCRSANAQDKI